MLSMKSVSKSYQHRGKTITALYDVTLAIPKGDFVAIVGPSGSGKSTFLLMFGGMLSPASGSVQVDGQSLYDMNSEQRAVVRREKIGFVFQTFNLVPYLTALENVQIPLFLADLSEEEQKIRAAALLERVGLGDRIDHKPSELSIGQQQRVALARMLANDPPIILADEPTGNLDPENAESIQEFLKEANDEGRTVVMVTHDMRAAQVARRTLRLVDGKILNGTHN
ncbi:MAG: Lipoprotein-releasing system ATP-binding protein LolD [Candidatus Hydrogenedentes bacterium ADurb.Bin179]|nr:MAG: Lipoprotein-releasing system ATP-binding protein LolD [Candidatus Hydrogenedentes bacterium ADurb.Bin179]